MPKLFKKRSEKGGLPPGTLVYVGEKKVEKVIITVFDYDRERYEEKELKAIEECFPYKDTPTVTWINMAGIHQVDLMEKIANHFGIHPLVIEDILNTGQRPKMDDLEDYLFVVLKMLDYNKEDDARCLPFQHKQQDERSYESADHYRNNFYSLDFPCRGLRNELQVYA